MEEKELLRLAKIEKYNRLLFNRYRQDPIFWLEDRFGEDSRSIVWSKYEGYENHKWDGDIDPLAQAWRNIAEGHWCGVESGTGTGKTHTLARIVLWFLDCFENSLVVTTAPKEDQLKLHLWTEIGKAFNKFKAIRPNAALYSLNLVVDDSKNNNPEDETAGWQAVGFVSGVGASEASATKAQGFHREHMLLIMEETPGIGFPVMTAFENTSTGGHNLILAVGNPDNETDTLHTFCKSGRVKSIRISGLDFPNIVLGKELVKGAVTQVSIDFRKDKYGEESGFYKSRVRGISQEQSTDSLIKLSWIEDCILEDYEEIDISGVPALGIDVANSESGDKAALAWGKGNTLTEMQEFQCPNATHLAYNLIMDDLELAKNKYQNYRTSKSRNIKPYNIGIDGVGVGVATINAFHDKGRKVVSLQGGQLERAIPKDNEGKPLFKFNSLRSQMYWELREDIRLGAVRFAVKDKTMQRLLTSELVVPKVDMKEKIAVEGKDSIKKRLGKSPNLADAAVYWNWVRKGHYKENNVILPFGI